MLSEVSFGALCVYSPGGVSEMSKRSRGLRDHVKRGSPRQFEVAAQRLADYFTRPNCPQAFRDLLGPDAVLVPVPGHAPLPPGHAFWGPRSLCEALRAVGIGSSVAPCLVRKHAVQKAALARPGMRPTHATHYASMAVEDNELWPDRITLIDDIVTQGATMLAAASRIQEAFPWTDHVSGFALIRTMSGQEVDALLDPCMGSILHVRDDYVRRRP